MSGSDPLSALEFLPLSGEAQERECAALMAASDPWVMLGQDVDSLLRTLRLPGRERYVARVNGRLAGLLLLNLQGTFAGYIQTVAVAPHFRGQGYGTRVIQFAEQRILRDHQNVFLCVSSFNHGARRWYASLGYREVGELTDFLVAGHSEFLLRKTIGPLGERTR